MGLCDFLFARRPVLPAFPGFPLCLNHQDGVGADVSHFWLEKWSIEIYPCTTMAGLLGDEAQKYEMDQVGMVTVFCGEFDF